MSAMFDHLRSIGYEPVWPEVPPEEGFAARAEREIGCHFPDTYREFLKEFPRTGACYDTTVVDAPHESRRFLEEHQVEWSVLFGCQENTQSDLIAMNNDPDTEIDDHIKIGDDIFGNWFYMQVGGGSKGAVFFLDRQRVNIWSPSSLIHVADSFEDFILKTYLTDEGEE
ncbi:MAG: SMI1/KNR4 family protein [Pseudomonadota bacterium]